MFGLWNNKARLYNLSSKNCVVSLLNWIWNKLFENVSKPATEDSETTRETGSCNQKTRSMRRM